MQNTFTVMPMSQRINLEPGQTFEGSITVANPATATEDFYFKVSVSPYSVSGTNYEPDFQTESDWSRITQWIKLETTSGVLKPNETKEVKFQIKVPSDAPAGGQYAMIGVTSDNKAKLEDTGSVQNVFEMASLIYAEVPGAIYRDGEIIKNYIPGFIGSGQPVAEVSFSNKGNIHEVATTTISIKNIITGEMILPKEDEDGVYETIVMPDSTRILSRELSGISPLGIYEVKQDIDYLGEQSSISTIMVVCPFWFIALVVLTILSIIGMVFYTHVLRKRKKTRSKTPDVDEGL